MNGFREFINEAVLDPLKSLKSGIVSAFVKAAEYLGKSGPDPFVQTGRKLGVVEKSPEEKFGEFKKAQSVIGLIVWELMRDMGQYAGVREKFTEKDVDRVMKQIVTKIGRMAQSPDKDKSEAAKELPQALTKVGLKGLATAIDQAWEVRRDKLAQIKNALLAGERVGEGFTAEDGPIFPEELPKIIASTKGTITREADPTRAGKWSGPQSPETQKYYTAKYRKQQQKLGEPPTIPIGPATQPPESFQSYKYYTPPEPTEEEPTILPFPKRKRR